MVVSRGAATSSTRRSPPWLRITAGSVNATDPSAGGRNVAGRSGQGKPVRDRPTPPTTTPSAPSAPSRSASRRVIGSTAQPSGPSRRRRRSSYSVASISPRAYRSSRTSSARLRPPGREERCPPRSPPNRSRISTTTSTTTPTTSRSTKNQPQPIAHEPMSCHPMPSPRSRFLAPEVVPSRAYTSGPSTRPQSVSNNCSVSLISACWSSMTFCASSSASGFSPPWPTGGCRFSVAVSSTGGAARDRAPGKEPAQRHRRQDSWAQACAHRGVVLSRGDTSRRTSLGGSVGGSPAGGSMSQALEELLHLADLGLLVIDNLLRQLQRLGVLPAVELLLGHVHRATVVGDHQLQEPLVELGARQGLQLGHGLLLAHALHVHVAVVHALHATHRGGLLPDRKSTRLNSSHVAISYAVFCMK